MEDGVIVDAKIRKVKNVEVLYVQKTYISSRMHDSVNICIYFVQFVHYLCVRKHTKVVSVCQLYRFCIVCTLFAHFLYIIIILSLSYQCSLCIQNIYKFVLCIILIYILSSFCTNFLVRAPNRCYRQCNECFLKITVT